MDEEGVIRKSSSKNFALPFKDPQTKKQNFFWYDWKEFLSKYSGISKWHSIKINDENKNVMYSDRIGNSYNTIQIIDDLSKIQSLPKIIEPLGLSQERQKYLEYFKSFIPTSKYD